MSANTESSSKAGEHAEPETAVLLADGLFRNVHAKTSHGLVRGPCRFRLVGVIDPSCAGRDAGEVLDGRHRGIPIFESIPALLAAVEETPDCCVVGVATVGGVLPPGLRSSLVAAAEAGMSLVNGLHRLLADDDELARITAEHGARIVDFRKSRPTRELRSWTGDVLSLETPRVAVLGTDCAVGKRTTASILVRACRERGIAAEMIFTGQTGWLQGYRYGFFFDATPNDFVCGELEGQILACAREARPDVIFLEGQSSLRNPSGPAGGELILSGGAAGVILQHAPGREFFDDQEELGHRIPPVAEEAEIIRLMGSEVWAVTLNEEGLDPGEVEPTRARLASELGVPVIRPLHDDPGELVAVLRRRLPGLPGGGGSAP